MAYHGTIQSVLRHDSAAPPTLLGFAPLCPSVLKPHLRKRKKGSLLVLGVLILILFKYFNYLLQHLYKFSNLSLPRLKVNPIPVVSNNLQIQAHRSILTGWLEEIALDNNPVLQNEHYMYINFFIFVTSLFIFIFSMSILFLIVSILC